MKETGIVMTGNHPKKILDGLETQTRRVVIPEWKKLIHDFDNAFVTSEGYKLHVPVRHPEEPDFSDQRVTRIYCPFGQVGDRLWVRETWTDLWMSNIDLGDVIYKATPPNPDFTVERWKPSRFMPRWASRILLEITEVRVERLQDITEEDARAEGLKAKEPEVWWQGYREIELGELGKELMHQQTLGDKPPEWMIEPHRMLDRPDLEAMFSAKNRFRPLWESLNAKRGYGWEANPWVWVISFELLADPAQIAPPMKVAGRITNDSRY